MNPKFCRTCRKPKPRESFRTIPGVKPKREVCESCWSAIKAQKRKAHDAA